MEPVLIVATAAVLLMVVERLAPGSPLPAIRGWWPRTIAINLTQVLVVYCGALGWDRWFPGLAWWHAEQLGTAPAIALGYLTITFVFYWWHRARHEIPLLWRWLHQVHHSAARLEVATSFYKHPLEILLNSLLSSFLLHVLRRTASGQRHHRGHHHRSRRTALSLQPAHRRTGSDTCSSGRRAIDATTSIGHHRDNYSDLPLWDILFGTFDNPRDSPRECGFGAARERQLFRMLLGKRPR